jgi:polyisoprenoid-binding protein YceI
MTTAVLEQQGLTTWAIDPSHSHVEFGVRHLMIATVKGRFTDVKGTVVTGDADPAKGSTEVTIGVASIDTREPQRDAHLKSADFFDVASFPEMTFRSTAIRDVKADGSFTLVGDLTIRGVSKEVALKVTSEGRTKDPWGGERSGFTASTTIKRSDFGLTWNVLLEAGGVTVGEDVKITIDAELVKQ